MAEVYENMSFEDFKREASLFFKVDPDDMSPGEARDGAKMITLMYLNSPIEWTDLENHQACLLVEMAYKVEARVLAREEI